MNFTDRNETPYGQPLVITTKHMNDTLLRELKSADSTPACLSAVRNYFINMAAEPYNRTYYDTFSIAVQITRLIDELQNV